MAHPTHCFPHYGFVLAYMFVKVTKLMERVEATFIKHFSNSNRTKGMKILRPQARKERHRLTFSLGKICTII